MKSWILVVLVLLFVISISSCQGQTHHNSQQSEVLSDDFDKSQPFAYGMPSSMTSTDTSPSWNHEGQKIILTGFIYQNDGVTPAPDVILYYYQTDAEGRYATDSDQASNMPKNTLGQTHGYIRGWIQTGPEGKYTIKTGLPGSYPNRSEPAHIHLTVQENHMSEPYYIDNFVFDHDPLLTAARRRKLENRGGSGIIQLDQKEDIWIGERNITLGLNIPNYKN